MSTRDFSVIGGRARRPDAAEKVTGRAVYTDDLKRPGMLHGALRDGGTPPKPDDTAAPREHGAS